MQASAAYSLAMPEKFVVVRRQAADGTFGEVFRDHVPGTATGQLSEDASEIVLTVLAEGAPEVPVEEPPAPEPEPEPEASAEPVSEPEAEPASPAE